MNYTFLIKTFERKESLWKLLKSIDKYYPNVKILIADDSLINYENETKEKFQSLNIEYYVLPQDVGISVGRNFLLEKVKTQYFLLLDDDFVIQKTENLDLIASYMKDNKVDIYGGYFVNFPIFKIKTNSMFNLVTSSIKKLFNLFKKPQKQYFVGNLYETKDTLIQIKTTHFDEKIKEVDFINNFFLADTHSVRKIGGWDKDLKISEHLEFFYRAKLNHLKVVFDRDFCVHHYPKRSNHYNQYRKRNFKDVFLLKYGFKNLISSHFLSNINLNDESTDIKETL